ncbi:hypothetical protein [Clostridium sp. OS1-26]|uniref:hypothetical protein n=1 Tax=Clostridium sp. OS1-26 TaxID=3070681 RepID=UPI0027DFE431|nr:hypothetical protein [Clostridium sp. OS1-26]WML36363.1 hypothetical protein RCG18_06695 [Clostridium sp. OS1-26]
MKLSLLLNLQLSYLILGILYNILSFYMKAYRGRALSFTSSLSGIIAMLTYGLCLTTGFLQYHNVYRFLMGISVIILGYSGIIVHILNYSKPNLYYSRRAWIFAILINLFGVVLNLIATLDKYTI